MLFMGEEWAASTPFMFFTDHGPQIGPYIKEGREKEFESWDLESVYDQEQTMIDPQDEQAFIQSTLNWEESRTGDHGRLRDFVRRLIQLRKSLADVASGDRSQTQCALDEDGVSGWLMRGSTFVAFARKSQVRLTMPSHITTIYRAWDEVTVTDQDILFTHPGVVIGAVSD